ncbi:MAG: hypothetical protein A4S09_04900 [Proteobacteria bacterium SG_bin7]|nr:MAG: hypothetical protein A4S09_04900 [Proteobacteria bacterium SG_bin7]
MRLLLFIWITFSLQAQAKSVPTEDEAKKIFAQYCKGGKQVKSIAESFTAKILKPEAGLPIDEAQKLITRRKGAAKTLAGRLFISYYGQDCTAGNTIGENEEIGNGVEFYKKDEKVTLAWFNFKSLEDLSTLGRYYSLRMPKEQQKRIFSHPSVRSEYFRPSCSEYDGCIGDVGYLGHNEQCHFSASRAISDSQRAFELIAQRYTKLTHSVGKDASTINLKVELDISVLCSYGILKSDLLSK